MKQSSYKRVNLSGLANEPEAQPSQGSPAKPGSLHVRWFIIPFSILLCVLQAVLTITASNIAQVWMTSTLITVTGFAALLLMVLGLNPLLRLTRLIRPLGRAELMTVFASMMVTAGIATFGLTDQLVPLIAAPWNPDWNDAQRKWDRDLLPYLNPGGYLTVTDDPPYKDRQRALDAIQAVLTRTVADGKAVGSKGHPADTLRRVVEGDHVDSQIFEAALRDIQSFSSGQSGGAMTAAVPTIRACYQHNASKQVILLFREGVVVTKPHEEDGWGKWWTYYSKVFFKIPWSAWIGPVAYWMVFVLACYGSFYFLAYVVLGYWTGRDKLIFPLARLPEALIPESDDSSRWFPPIFVNAAFWIGFLFSAGVMTYNALAHSNILPGMDVIPLNFKHEISNALRGIPLFEGLASRTFNLRYEIMFTAIGIAFLLPKEVSFSIWFYFWVGRFIILIAVWLGYGQTDDAFPTDWLWEANPVTAQGSGALMMFSTICLYRAVADYVRLAKGMTIGQRLQLFMPVIGLGVCLTVVVGWLCWNWWPSTTTSADRFTVVLWACIFVLFITLLTLGLMRIVAESGVYWMQVFGGSFFHYYKMLGLGSMLKSTLVAPLLPIYSVIFLDIKTFIAPNIMNAAKMREDVATSRARYHLTIVCCIVLTVGFALAGTIYLAHERGANQMDSWFFTRGPIETLERTAKAGKMEPAFEPVNTAWCATGAGWISLTMYLRRSIFWFPHPIGYIMMNNPLMSAMWFSFFIGWATKALIVKYGGKFTFDRVRIGFIGLILGELIAIFLFSILRVATGTDFGSITLNRIW